MAILTINSKNNIHHFSHDDEDIDLIQAHIWSVSWRKGKNKWVAQIKVNYKNIWLGYYDNKEEAAAAYQAAATKYHKEFAKT